MNSCNWQFSHPVRVMSGRLEKLLEVIDAEKVLLVTTAGFSRRGVSDRIIRALGNNRVRIYDEVSPNPDLADLDTAINRLKSDRFDAVLAVGGGSVIDAAKVIAAGINMPGENPLTKTLIEKIQIESHGRTPVYAVPTTAGTGSEVTQFATVWNRADGRKYSLEGENIFPAMAFLDPELTLTLPADETLFTGLDVISHALESIWNRNLNPCSLMYAETALGYAGRHFHGVLRSPDNILDRAGMQLASLFAGYAISVTRTALAHAISYPLTARCNMPHGLACSFTLAAIGELYLSASDAPARQKSLVAEALSVLAGLDLKSRLATYASHEKIISLLPEMFNPSRAGNFALPADATTVETILRRSLA